LQPLQRRDEAKLLGAGFPAPLLPASLADLVFLSTGAGFPAASVLTIQPVVLFGRLKGSYRLMMAEC
jgi:hypothetical protein